MAMTADQRLSEAIRQAMAGYAPGESRDVWISEYLLPSLAAFGLEVTDTGALARATQLRDGARAQCERRTAELAEAHARLRIADRDATVGRAVLNLAAEIMRLREMAVDRPADFPFANTTATIAALVSCEVAEASHERPGSEDAQRECGDVFAAAVHLMIAHGACLLAEIDAVASRIEERLDAMEECGCTWSEAKRVVSMASN
jgi:NTP pyrophosphatase (non-canonical NTP hydrolase)